MKTSLEIDFLRTYKDFIFYFNMLERNIGYCLWHCSSKVGSKNSKKWNEESFDRKIRKLMELVELNSLTKEFKSWHEKVLEIRTFRNVVVHGQWEWKEWLEKPIRYHSPEFSDMKGEYSVQEFQSELENLKLLFEEFDALRTPLERAIEKSIQLGN